MTTYFRKYSIVLVFVFTLILSASITNAVAESSKPEPVKLKVLVLPYMGYAPFFIAQEEGYFAEQGLEIEFVKMSGGSSKVIPALIQGELDVSAGTVNIGVLNALIRGGALKIVADMAHIASSGCPARSLFVRRDLFETGELVQPAQLQGRRIAVNPKSIDGYYVEKILHMADLTFEDVSVKYVPSAVLLEGFETGTLDVVFTAEPWVTRMLKTGQAVLWNPARDIIPNFQYAVVLYGPTLFEEKPDIGRRFMIAYLKAARQYNQGKTERNVDILAKHTGLESRLLQEVCWSSIRDDGSMNADSILDFQQWALEKGLLDKIVPAKQFLDSSFAEHANKVLGEVSSK